MFDSSLGFGLRKNLEECQMDKSEEKMIPKRRDLPSVAKYQIFVRV
jgi:hypothetical protein